jgi:hypothetical protein
MVTGHALVEIILWHASLIPQMLFEVLTCKASDYMEAWPLRLDVARSACYHSIIITSEDSMAVSSALWNLFDSSSSYAHGVEGFS